MVFAIATNFWSEQLSPSPFNLTNKMFNVLHDKLWAIQFFVLVLRINGFYIKKKYIYFIGYLMIGALMMLYHKNMGVMSFHLIPGE